MARARVFSFETLTAFSISSSIETELPFGEGSAVEYVSTGALLFALCPMCPGRVAFARDAGAAL